MTQTITSMPELALPSSRLSLRKPNHRFRACMAVALLVHLLIFAPSFLNFSCTHDRPKGLPGGSGDKIAKGTPQGAEGGTGKGKTKPKAQNTQPLKPVEFRARVLAAEKQSRKKFLERLSLDGLRQLLIAKNQREVRPDSAAQMQTAMDSMGATGLDAPGPRGLADGQGNGPTAAGSPFGTRIGAKLWLYRVKYSGGDWDANPKALPALLHEVKLALNLKDVGAEEVIKMSDLPKHRGDFMPSMLFMTGTGAIESTEAERKALRDYLLGGGFIVGDSSGGNFEHYFKHFIADVLPGKTFRPIEFDHDVYRGQYMHYKLAAGCPIYRDHGSNEAKAIFDEDGRIMVFFSPGDMGSAWAVVDLGRKRGDVEASFQMGTNLVTYSLMTVQDKRK
jgi:hypothetical protein